jgi:hypothetical protein
MHPLKSMLECQRAPGPAGRIDATSNSILTPAAFCHGGMGCDDRDGGDGTD